MSTDPAERIVPYKLGLKSRPPKLILMYHKWSGGIKKLRRRDMPLRKFTETSDVKKFAFLLRHRHTAFLADVPAVVIEKMMRIIQEIRKGINVDEASEAVDKEYEINPEEDLNKVSLAELSRKKEIMQESFQRNLIRPGDPGFVYDHRVDFSGPKEPSPWDDEDDDEEFEKSLQDKPEMSLPDRQLSNGDADKPATTNSVEAGAPTEVKSLDQNAWEAESNIPWSQGRRSNSDEDKPETTNSAKAGAPTEVEFLKQKTLEAKSKMPWSQLGQSQSDEDNSDITNSVEAGAPTEVKFLEQKTLEAKSKMPWSQWRQSQNDEDKSDITNSVEAGAPTEVNLLDQKTSKADSKSPWPDWPLSKGTMDKPESIISTEVTMKAEVNFPDKKTLETKSKIPWSQWKQSQRDGDKPVITNPVETEVPAEVKTLKQKTSEVKSKLPWSQWRQSKSDEDKPHITNLVETEAPTDVKFLDQNTWEAKSDIPWSQGRQSKRVEDKPEITQSAVVGTTTEVNFLDQKASETKLNMPWSQWLQSKSDEAEPEITNSAETGASKEVNFLYQKASEAKSKMPWSQWRQRKSDEDKPETNNSAKAGAPTEVKFLKQKSLEAKSKMPWSQWRQSKSDEDKPEITNSVETGAPTEVNFVDQKTLEPKTPWSQWRLGKSEEVQASTDVTQSTSLSFTETILKPRPKIEWPPRPLIKNEVVKPEIPEPVSLSDEEIKVSSAAAQALRKSFFDKYVEPKNVENAPEDSKSTVDTVNIEELPIGTEKAEEIPSLKSSKSVTFEIIDDVESEHEASIQEDQESVSEQEPAENALGSVKSRQTSENNVDSIKSRLTMSNGSEKFNYSYDTDFESELESEVEDEPENMKEKGTNDADSKEAKTGSPEGQGPLMSTEEKSEIEEYQGKRILTPTKFDIGFDSDPDDYMGDQEEEEESVPELSLSEREPPKETVPSVNVSEKERQEDSKVIMENLLEIDTTILAKPEEVNAKTVNVPEVNRKLSETEIADGTDPVLEEDNSKPKISWPGQQLVEGGQEGKLEITNSAEAGGPTAEVNLLDQKTSEAKSKTPWSQWGQTKSRSYMKKPEIARSADAGASTEFNFLEQKTSEATAKVPWSQWRQRKSDEAEPEITTDNSQPTDVKCLEQTTLEATSKTPWSQRRQSKSEDAQASPELPLNMGFLLTEKILIPSPKLEWPTRSLIKNEVVKPKIPEPVSLPDEEIRVSSAAAEALRKSFFDKYVEHKKGDDVREDSNSKVDTISGVDELLTMIEKTKNTKSVTFEVNEEVKSEHEPSLKEVQRSLSETEHPENILGSIKSRLAVSNGSEKPNCNYDIGFESELESEVEDDPENAEGSEADSMEVKTGSPEGQEDLISTEETSEVDEPHGKRILTPTKFDFRFDSDPGDHMDEQEEESVPELSLSELEPPKVTDPSAKVPEKESLEDTKVALDKPVEYDTTNSDKQEEIDCKVIVLGADIGAATDNNGSGEPAPEDEHSKLPELSNEYYFKLKGTDSENEDDFW